MTAPTPRRRPPAQFQPRFTLMLFYVFAFFFGYCLLLVAPPLIETYRGLPPGASDGDLELAARVARDAVRPRLWIALAAAVVTTALGGYAGVLPGVGKRTN